MKIFMLCSFMFLNAIITVAENNDKNNFIFIKGGTSRINRGGGWNDFGKHLRSAYRAASQPNSHFFNIGFRVVRNAK